jgi:Zn-dependent protease with chaperone function
VFELGRDEMSYFFSEIETNRTKIRWLVVGYIAFTLVFANVSQILFYPLGCFFVDSCQVFGFSFRLLFSGNFPWYFDLEKNYLVLTYSISVVLLIFILISTLRYWYILWQENLLVRQLSGEKLDPNQVSSPDFKVSYSQLEKLVEEMCIAANMPMIDIYIIPESSINALVASTRSKHCLYLTEGCMKNLDRQELQALVAHEISHIINGDTRHDNFIFAGIFAWNCFLFLIIIFVFWFRNDKHSLETP